MDIDTDALDEFFELLRFKSISTDDACKEEIKKCAAWIKQKLDGIGFQTELWETTGHPVLFAEHPCEEKGKPTLLIYNHYDVQPVDPIEEWRSPPFEPEIRDGNIYARGAQDNKGQLFYTLLALRKLKKLPFNLKWVIEGDEECGSEGLEKILPEKKERLKADYLAVVDLGIPSMARPSITLGLRGIATFEMTLYGSNSDLHSGSHGGIVYNPLHALAEMIAGLRDKEGKILVPGFYDDVAELTPEERGVLDFSFDEKEYKELFDAKAEGGEKRFPPQERGSSRPTLEINGISGGYAGPGFKTVIPAKASAKFSCRLVPDQDPKKIAAAVMHFLKKRAPEGVRLEIRHLHGGLPLRSKPDSKVAKAFAEAYREVFDRPCSCILSGGSIPVAAALADASGAEAVLVGLGLPGDCIHAPNEHFSIERLDMGRKIIEAALLKLA